ncbi:hypothetical protein TNIN_235621 [Trichonephila inaurata madagascariensis]|uniref:Uncharacterized protein n=1 Tax=Trichonephila inaurata madagascariensis TaxID=2747483 RepID=A0A8X6XBP1_9ARAC|nr:hypothetical protein TNIN_235621 [Trichonephila inaurata madagascariensis]
MYSLPYRRVLPLDSQPGRLPEEGDLRDHLQEATPHLARTDAIVNFLSYFPVAKDSLGYRNLPGRATVIRPPSLSLSSVTFLIERHLRIDCAIDRWMIMHE